MDNNSDIKFINDFYDNPKKISNDEYLLIKKLLYKYKKEIIEEKYYLYVAENDTITKLFILFLYYIDYNLNKNKITKSHTSIDFEFNNQKIALMQLKLGKYVWILNPKKYDKQKINVINEKLLLNNKIYKVLHGADSLDLPYMYSELFDNDKEKILAFTMKFIDSRFLCEYVRSSLKEEGRCSIYDAMLYFNTIDQNKYDELTKINESMGPIQDVMWDIKKMSSFHIKYAYYDVLYLVDFLFDIYKKIIKETPEYLRTYFYIVQLLRFVILERKGVTNILDISKNVVNPMNNYLIKTKNGNITLINVYNDITKNLILKDEKGNIYLDFIENLNYVRGTFSYILKHISYYVIGEIYTIYKNKIDIMNEKIDIKKLYIEMKKNKMYKIFDLLKLFEKEIYNKIKTNI